VAEFERYLAFYCACSQRYTHAYFPPSASGQGTLWLARV